MRRQLKRIKDKLFFVLVEKNEYVVNNYIKYREYNDETDKKNRVFRWIRIIQWNIDILLKPNLRIEPHLKVNETKNIPKAKGIESKAMPEAKGIESKFSPYTKGSESENVGSRLPAHQFAKSLLKYDVISFDIFDTLIFRPFANPRDVFHILSEKFNYQDYFNIRNELEKVAREKHAALKGNREVTIFDIYEEVEHYTGINKNYGVKIEFETELELCYANPYMQRVFEILKEQGKRIIAVSDMYLPKEMIEALLTKCGYEGFEQVFVSCEHNANKITKGLYKIVINNIGKDKKIVHIGDNYKADVTMAKEVGLNAVFYRNVNSLGNGHRATFDGMSEIIGSSYGGIVNSKLHNGLNIYSPYYEYGYIYGGIYVLGFCRWVKEYAEKNKIDKVLFLARDGHIYNKVYKMLYPNHNAEYVLWSRIINSKVTAEKDRYNFIQRMIRVKVRRKEDIEIGDLLKSLKLDSLINKLKEYRLNEKDVVVHSNLKQVENLFVDNWESVIEAFNEESQLAKEYYKYYIGDAKNVAVVDVGWQGTSGFGLKWGIEEKWNLGVKVVSLLAASHSGSVTFNQSKMLNNKLDSYIFSRFHNRELYDFHDKTNSGMNSYMFELFTQSTSPTFVGFTRDDQNRIAFQFGTAEVENNKAIDEIHKGIYEFSCEYYSAFKKYPFMLSISGHDAYIPFKMIARHSEFFKECLGDLTYSITTDNMRKQEIKTIKEILTNKSL